MKKILITGANGMIGSALAREFINKYELILVDSYKDRIVKYSGKATIIQKDFIKIHEWENVLRGVYCIVHLAAAVHWIPKTSEEEKHFMEINTEGTALLYDTCSKYSINKFLFFSTNDVYKASDHLITEDTPVDPSEIYGKSKFLAEQYLLNAAKSSSTNLCILRPASVYGENDKGSMKTLIGLCQKGIIPMIGEGTNRKSLLYLKDLVQVVEKYIDIEEDINSEILNVSSGDFGYKEIIDTICECYGFRPCKVKIPIWFCSSIASKIGSLQKLKVASETKVTSNNKVYELLGFRSKYNLETGLLDAKDYYLENNK